MAVAWHDRQPCRIQFGLDAPDAVLVALTLRLRGLQVAIAAVAAAQMGGGKAVVKMKPGA
ncbi:hypothetical protein AJ87_44555 [Rhizobium yanglingense]|nr:hypothetical protein AJ87_44555 [Rhizobium yanglingense]